MDRDFICSYFRLKDDLPRILLEIGKDKEIKNAIRSLRGLRILRQDPWECLISYICATYKNIPAIRRMLDNLSARFGKKMFFEGQVFHEFPTVESLARADLGKLQDCGLGYRAKYVSETAMQILDEDINLDDLRRTSYDFARQKLLKFSGVGLKVADCVLLFSLEKLEAFPVDVWIKRALLQYYSTHFSNSITNYLRSNSGLSECQYRKLSMFGKEYFGRYAGYAQEYLYYYAREGRC